MISPTFWKELTSESCSKFIWIMTFTSWQLLTMTMFLSMLVSMPYTCSLFSGIVVISPSYFLVSPITSITHWKWSLLRTLRFILTEMVDCFPGFVALFEEVIGECWWSNWCIYVCLECCFYLIFVESAPLLSWMSTWPSELIWSLRRGCSYSILLLAVVFCLRVYVDSATYVYRISCSTESFWYATKLRHIVWIQVCLCWISSGVFSKNPFFRHNTTSPHFHHRSNAFLSLGVKGLDGTCLICVMWCFVSAWILLFVWLQFRCIPFNHGIDNDRAS